MAGAARRAEPRYVERPWGAESLGPWFPPSEARIGEVWFDTPPLLIKYLFTTAPLSVQVHPDDPYARAHEGCAGKTEMWHVLDAAPEARIALGFRQTLTRDQVRAAALDGSIEHLLRWYPAAPGDSFFTPAGTVHALGAGLVVLEIQQLSDITYRLYDYQRGRPLHLDKALDVLDPGPHPGKSVPRPLDGGGVELARCSWFGVESWCLAAPKRFPARSIVMPVEGAAMLDGEPVHRGGVWQLDGDAELEPQGQVRLIRAYVP